MGRRTELGTVAAGRLLAFAIVDVAVWYWLLKDVTSYQKINVPTTWSLATIAFSPRHSSVWS
jgi:hypothetical protein